MARLAGLHDELRHRGGEVVDDLGERTRGGPLERNVLPLAAVAAVELGHADEAAVGIIGVLVPSSAGLVLHERTGDFVAGDAAIGFAKLLGRFVFHEVRDRIHHLEPLRDRPDAAVVVAIFEPFEHVVRRVGLPQPLQGAHESPGVVAHAAEDRFILLQLRRIDEPGVEHIEASPAVGVDLMID